MLSEALVSVYTRRVTGRRHVFIEYNKVVQAGNNIVHCTDCTSPGSRCSMKKQNISIFLHWLGSLKICSNFYRNEYLELDYRTLFIKIISIKHCIVLSKIFISKNNSKSDVILFEIEFPWYTLERRVICRGRSAAGWSNLHCTQNRQIYPAIREVEPSGVDYWEAAPLIMLLLRGVLGNTLLTNLLPQPGPDQVLILFYWLVFLLECWVPVMFWYALNIFPVLRPAVCKMRWAEDQLGWEYVFINSVRSPRYPKLSPSPLLSNTPPSSQIYLYPN